ncbi:MAG TPA: hypothetical protein VFU94_10255 [Conexibacter sp.]|nr:hypothetical protein [Conexibacter sp.]
MHAAITVTHKPGDFLGRLAVALPPEDRTCLSRSLVFAQRPEWQALVAFAAETPHWRIAIYADGADQWQMIVEPVHGELRVACQSVWRTILATVGELSPRLERLEIVDEATMQTLVRASVGLLPQMRRRELWLPLAVGVANAVVLVATGVDSATLHGAIPGLVAAGIALLVIILDAIRASLVWHA